MLYDGYSKKASGIAVAGSAALLFGDACVEKYRNGHTGLKPLTSFKDISMPDWTE